MLDSQQYEHPLRSIQQIISLDDLLAAQRAVREVYLNHDIKNYIVNLVTTSRQHPDVYLGASPRGALALYRTTQARAALAGRDYVIPDDVKALAESTLAHRIIVGPNARIKDISASSIIHNILNTVPVPGATVGARF